MKRLGAVLVGLGIALVCAARLRRHDPERVATAAGFGYRCRNCGATAATELELLERTETGHVDPERPDQRVRLHPGRKAS